MAFREVFGSLLLFCALHDGHLLRLRMRVHARRQLQLHHRLQLSSGCSASCPGLCACILTAVAQRLEYTPNRRQVLGNRHLET